MEIIIDCEVLQSDDKSDLGDMTHNMKKPPDPGPGDPLPAKRKHHDRSVFEYISKAFKMDEGNDGTIFFYLFYLLPNNYFLIFIHSSPAKKVEIPYN